MSGVSRGIDRIEVIFDDPNLVANAGLVLVATLAARLELEALINATVRLAGRVGGALPGRKVLTLVHAIVAGGSHIDHADVLRAGATGSVLAHRVMAPSTLGTFLRSFSFGHVRQLDKVIGETIRRAWALGAGPGSSRLVIDIDSTICEVAGKNKQGASFGYTKVLGYHPILATRADTGEVLHARMRKGSANTQRGARRFIDELIARVRRAGAAGSIVVRVDSGFWSNETIKTLARLDVRYTMAVRTNTKGVAAAIAAIDEALWVDIDYTLDGQAQVAECIYKQQRLIVRRTRLTDTAQARLWPDWRHHAFLTDLDGDTVTLDAFHRHHAVVELAIRDLKEGAGLEHIPSGKFFANAAWLACAVLAHNLIRWTATSATSSKTITSPLLAPSAPGSSRYPAGSSTWPASPPCAARSTGRGATSSPAPSRCYAPYDRCPSNATARGAAHRRQTPRADNPHRHTPCFDAHPRRSPRHAATIGTHPPAAPTNPDADRWIEG